MENQSTSEDIEKEKGEIAVLETLDTPLRKIPIEVLQNDCENDVEIIGTILDLDESDIQQLLSEELKSNRTSLIITHEDGSTEETETEVTCLGVTPEGGQRNSLFIQEIVMAANNIPKELGKQNDNDTKEEKASEVI